ncbi:unnamed protein product [Ilex paraguariensis]|uniref:Uncharacterized protein n=1 Tax=Ilex paraguariensis TaxID=185542 RepID=A0ABC8RJM0_9AQUA
MRNRWLATSDDEDDAPPPPPPSRSSNTDEVQENQRKRKKLKLNEEEEEEEEERREKKNAREEEQPESGDEEEKEDEAVQEDAKPIGEVVRVSGKGRGKRNHYKSFEFDGLEYNLEDPVLLAPEESHQKPYVAIIKDITQTNDGSMMVTGQWFYRPEEAEKRGGGNWQSNDTRELFYSFHRDEVPAEAVMHKCVVHFIPLNKQIPKRKQHPGFIMQRVYDNERSRLFNLTGRDYEDNKQHEIDDLIQKTSARLGDLPDIETEGNTADQEDQLRNKGLLRKKNMPTPKVSREEETITSSGQPLRTEALGSCTRSVSEYYNILSNFKALTGEMQRDKWLEKLLQAIQFMCSCIDSSRQNDGKKSVDLMALLPLQVERIWFATNPRDNSKLSERGSRRANIFSEAGLSFRWPDAAVPAIAALEKASHEAHSSDFQKYNQKMRQLTFNLKNNAGLAERLLSGELEPAKILNMSPTELKEGLTAEELTRKQPEESERMQMTDARCKRCMEKNVGLIDIIQAGRGNRYQVGQVNYSEPNLKLNQVPPEKYHERNKIVVELECIACGNTWYASSDEASTLTIDRPNSVRSVGIAPWATAKFEDVEKKLLSPRESEKSINDALKKTTEAHMPVLANQRSFNKS